MKRHLRTAHPFLFAAAPILKLYAENMGDVKPGIVVVTAMVSILAAAVLMGLFSFFTRCRQRGSLLASLVLILFFLYGHVFDLVTDHGLPAKYGHFVVGFLWLLLLAIGVVIIVRTKKDLANFSTMLVVAGGLMIGMPAYQIAIHAMLNVSARSSSWSTELLDLSQPAPVAPILENNPKRPDVYYIILDGYARADVLQNVYGFDNGEFLSELSKRGFFIADKSVANYPMTYLSLASSLNLNYLDKVVNPTRDEDRSGYYKSIQNPLIGRIFRSHGYRFIHFATNYRGTEDSEIADMVLSHRPRWLRSEFMEVLLRTSALRPFEPNVADIHLYTFQTLHRIPDIAGPKFVFAHFVVPHNPYVFDRFGNIRHNIPLRLQFKEKTGGWQDRVAYIDQLIFVNGKVLESIDAILARSKTPPVIILQSDHGSASLVADEKTNPEQWKAFVRERLPILNAYLVPSTMRSNLTSDMSPVNSFRLLCNELFDAGMEQLPVRSYMGWYGKGGVLRDVTDIAQLGAPEPGTAWTAAADTHEVE